LGTPPADPGHYLMQVARDCLARHEWNKALSLADRVLAKHGRNPESLSDAHLVKLHALIGARRFGDAEVEADCLCDFLAHMPRPATDGALPPMQWLSLGG
jgi:hypothetical protein